MIKLSSAIQIISGYAFRDGLSSLSAGDTRLIRPSDLDDFDEDKLERYEINAPWLHLNQDDILLSNKGKFRSALVEKSGEYAVPSSIFILRPQTANIHMPYLVAFLNSRNGQAALALLARGSNIPALTKSALENLEIPNLPKEKQKQIADMTKQIDNYRRLTAEKIYATEELINQLMKEENSK